jgi:hypothetical protein
MRRVGKVLVADLNHLAPHRDDALRAHAAGVVKRLAVIGSHVLGQADTTIRDIAGGSPASRGERNGPD